jgi:streptogrisin C
MKARTAVTAFAAVLVLPVVLPVTAAATSLSAPDAVPAEVLAAMQRDLGLTADQVFVRVAQETKATAIEGTLRDQLGSSFGGAWFSPSLGKLVVGVTDANKLGTVRAAGAEGKVVGSSASQLDTAKSDLDRASAPAGVNGWYVDEADNSLVVELNSAPSQATRTFLANAHGVTVRTVRTAQATPLANVRGGDAWFGPGFRCSVGFSARTSSGAKRMVTAGHCTEGGGTASGFNNVTMGPINGSVFSLQGDFGKVDVTSSSWTLAATVNRYGQGDLTVHGSTAAATGASVCRSGSTTGWHCGTIQAKNQTVNYPNRTVQGLTRTNVCAEPGDSGGSFITTAGQAQGMTSGGSGNCTSGGTTFFQPVNEALSTFGLTLATA